MNKLRRTFYGALVCFLNRSIVSVLSIKLDMLSRKPASQYKNRLYHETRRNFCLSALNPALNR